VLVDRDLTRVAPEAIREARVLVTVVGGRVVHEREPQR
jgi:predicted amidohydrolase YtcJ